MKNLIRSASKAKSTETPESGDNAIEEDHSMACQVFRSILGKRDELVFTTDDCLLDTCLTSAIAQDDVNLVRMLLRHTAPDHQRHLKQLVARLASTDGTEPTLFIPSDGWPKEGDSSHVVSDVQQPNLLKVRPTVESPVMTTLLWLAVVVQGIYVLLILVQAMDLIRPMNLSGNNI